jgi:hypothetical protein
MRNPVILAFINWLGTALLFLLTAYFPHELIAATTPQTEEVHRTAAPTQEYSDGGHGWWNAVFEVVGVIYEYDPETQTCVPERRNFYHV